MRTAFYTLACVSLFLTLSFKSFAQVPPDTARLALGGELGMPAGNIKDTYLVIAGVSARFDLPFSKRSYITASVGFNNYYLADASTSTQVAILNYPLQSLKTVPFKLGYKYFLIKKFYVQGEVGETLLANKATVFATNSATFTYSAGFGLLFKFKRHTHSYIDTGIRYEGASSFYNDQDKYNFWNLHVAYAFNL